MKDELTTYCSKCKCMCKSDKKYGLCGACKSGFLGTQTMEYKGDDRGNKAGRGYREIGGKHVF